MKFLIICSAIIVGAFAYKWDPQELECMSELGIKESDMEDVTDPIEEPSTIDNKLYNQLTECSWKKLKLIDDAGSIDWDSVKKVVKAIFDKVTDSKNEAEESVSEKSSEEELHVELLTDCDIPGDDIGQKLVKVQNCIGANFRKIVKN